MVALHTQTHSAAVHAGPGGAPGKVCEEEEEEEEETKQPGAKQPPFCLCCGDEGSLKNSQH